MTRDIAVDVLIVGGGPQGFWLLERLTHAGLSCLLIEKLGVGGGQAAHAEWFLHRGAVSRATQSPNKAIPGADYVNDLNDSAAKWETHLQSTPNGNSALQSHPTLYGFKLGRNLGWEKWCQSRGIFIQRMRGVQRPGVSTFYRTNEVTVNPGPVFSDWLNRFPNHVVHVHDFTPVMYGGRVSSVQLHFTDRPDQDVSVGAVTVAAGAANRELLEGKFAVPSNELDTVFREGMLLAIRGSSLTLPPENFCLLDSGHILIISRTDANQETMMLVSTGDSWSKPDQPHPNNADWVWIRAIWSRLQQFVPALQSPQGLQFQISVGELKYPTELKDPTLKPTARRPCKFSTPSNVILVAPPRLTLAPCWADEALPLIQACLPLRPSVRQNMPTATHPPVTPHYEGLGFMAWNAFQAKYQL